MNLDNHKIYQKLDKGMVTKSIELLPDQIRQVLSDARLIKIPREYSKVSQVVVNGMGGSNIGAKILKSAFAKELKVPLLIEPGYNVPAYVNKNTLYLISSYSGTTEEPLSVYQEVKKRGAKILAITENSKKSKLRKLMLKENIPGYTFTPNYNPSKQPRLGNGYTFFGIAVLLAKSGLLIIKVKNINNIIAELEINTIKLHPEAKTKNNQAKKIALKLKGKIPTLIAAEHLIGNIKTLRNQMSETSKQIPNYLTLPDLNHFALEGLAYPTDSKKMKIFLFFDSFLYHLRIQKRSELTKKVAKKNGTEILSYALKGKTKLAQSFELLQLGSWISYYLSILNNVNPEKIPFVDWFKKELK
ncbi:MAG: SIS domain-containing protein [Patescibacteria group bacterium]